MCFYFTQMRLDLSLQSSMMAATDYNRNLRLFDERKIEKK